MTNSANSLQDLKELENGSPNLPTMVRPSSFMQQPPPPVILENKSTLRLLYLLRFGVFVLLAALIAVFGSVSFVYLRGFEMENFDQAYHSSVIQISGSIDVNLRAKFSAGSVVNNIFAYGIQDGHLGKLPNVTLPGFSAIMNSLSDLAYARGISFLPLVTSKTRHSWEAYAKNNVKLLEGPPSLQTSINGSWTVADGCYSVTRDGQKTYSTGWNEKSIFPDILLPTWQISHLDMYYGGIMYDAHSSAVRAQVLDRAISTKKPAFTDIVQLILDTKLRPSTNLYYPITTIDTNEVVGMSVLGFSWDDVFKGILPSYLSGFVCVISTSTQIFTYELSKEGFRLLGAGDLHDSQFDRFKTDISASLRMLSEMSDFNYRLTLYPTTELYEKYNTNTPAIVCGATIGVVVFTAVIILLYLWLLFRREQRLTGTVQFTTKMTSMTLHELEVKKSFVRYISHEIRTPLNTVKLGLDVLEHELVNGVPRASVQSTLQDIKASCHTALEVVNEFLLFDKIVSETLVLERAPMNIHSFVTDSLRPIYISAKQKDITLEFINELSDEDAGRRFNVHIDKHKMAQVVSNLLSNALKFTPPRGSVTVTLRTPEVNVSEEFRPPGFLIIVQDTGIGISKENQSKLFSQIIQFSPSELQEGGGSGLGLFVSYTILRKHGGNLSVSSEGIGQGTTFTIQLPRYESRPPLLGLFSDGFSSGRMAQRSYYSSVGAPSDTGHRQLQRSHILSTISNDVDATSRPCEVKKGEVDTESRLDITLD